MIRFSLRSRSKPYHADPGDREQSPPGLKTSRRKSSSQTSYLVNYDQLPTRLPNGHALSYATYVPSMYYIPSTSRRKPRNANLRNAANALDLDAASLTRRNNIAQVPAEKRIEIMVQGLRNAMSRAEQLGDVEVLKDLVGIHEATLTRLKQKIAMLRANVREAKIIAGMIEPEHTPALVRKLSGRPVRFRMRSVSALKGRPGGNKGVSRNSVDIHHEHEQAHGGQQTQQRQHFRAKHDFGRLTRKSSARLKRLGSAGSVLIRRLSKVSVAEDASSGSSTEHTSSTFDQETMRRLRVNPMEVISGYEKDRANLTELEKDCAEKLRVAQQQLHERKALHHQVMETLDRFYGGLPGWQDDAISRVMIQETADLTEAGIEAERDLAEARALRERARAAREDHARTLDALLMISTELRLFECAMAKVLSGEQMGVRPTIVVARKLNEMTAHLEQCVQSVRVARQCCADAEMLRHLQGELGSVCEGFEREVRAVQTQGTFYKADLAGTLKVVRGCMRGCKQAEGYLEERQNLIVEDLKRFDGIVEKFEEYVIMERVGIMDMHHPVKR